MAETNRRREKQKAYNEANGITPQSVKRNIEDIINSPYERDRVTVDKGQADKAISIGHNFEACWRISKSACARRRRISISRKPRASATRSSASRPPNSLCSRSRVPGRAA